MPSTIGIVASGYNATIPPTGGSETGLLLLFRNLATSGANNVAVVATLPAGGAPRAVAAVSLGSAVTFDTSTVASWRNGTGPAATSASATLPSGKVILVAVESDGDVGATQTCTVTNSGSALTWHTAVIRNDVTSGSTYAAFSGLFWAVGDGAAHTITVTMANTKPVAAKCVIATGANTTAPIGAVGNSETASSNASVAGYTSTVNGSLGLCCCMDWNNGGGATSTDSFETHSVTGPGDGITIWKAATTPTAGTAVSFNVQQTGPNWLCVSAEIVP